MTSDPAMPRLTVRHLLEVPRFRLRLVAGAAGLDRPIRSAHSTELLDPSPYLRGHEVVLTAGASLRDPDACAAFAAAVKAGRGGAIAYGVGDVCETVPEALARHCDRLGLPLVEVPAGVAFVGFTEWFAERLASTREEWDEREETGRLLRDVQEGLLPAEALRPQVEEAGLDPDMLVAVAMPAAEAPDGADAPGVLGLDDDVALVITGDEYAGTDVAGIGTPGPLGSLPRSLAEARAALEAARRTGGVVHAAGLATFRALLGRLEPHHLAPFAEQIARPLADYDEAHGGRLVETLRAFLDRGGAVGPTARALSLHPSTLRHRLSRIEALTGRDPLDFEDRAALAIAVWTAG
ncbi:PucR family transcriptional regulator [Actinomadura verrucosospora]|uniref:CdaR family transcriptional regulator n=1 Tax=Actinomadura verrucosospora TaxID=46165 RepID=A0A7D3W3I7_ACTVE|nr:PucR family transcriptional regulator [Actinomadura verrucosospora]QKG25356.1 CdaR family transcriptional regulator [Actinomadura verrucosospora]